MTFTHSASVREPIAVIGSSCRLPGGVTSPSKLWELLKAPRDLQRDIPQSSFNAKGFYHEDPEHHGTSNVLKSYTLVEDVRLFDNSFFSINPKEAESMDPQHRILLETVYEGIESAGYTIGGLRGSSTSVYIGQMTADYNDVLARDFETIPQYFSTGTSRCITSNRVSYFFDWKGPSVTIDTACSSSLVAVHQAIQDLRYGSSGLAVAAGVNLILGPEMYIHESKLHMLSPDGRSRMWDAKANGYARGEGFAVVVLKTLSQAIADGDDIECVIRETGVNQDGRTNGISMPSQTSQAALIRSTYQRSGLDCTKIEDRCQFFEAHGTGTPAGDPVEAEAVANAFFVNGIDSSSDSESSDNTQNRLYVGSIKTIIGHLEGTAGVVALLRASLAVQNGMIPPNMHFNSLNPQIEPFYTHLSVPTKLMPWPAVAPGAPRRVSVNSFGFGGTNAHAIIESYEPDKAMHSPRTWTEGQEACRLPRLPCGPLTLSANSPTALTGAVAALSDMLKTRGKEVDLVDLAYTLQMRRTEFPIKASFSATTIAELITKLDAATAAAAAVSGNIDKKALAPWVISSLRVPATLPPRIMGVFTGQGAQWPRMGAELYVHSDAFRRSIQALDASLASLPDPPTWSLVGELLATPESSRVHEAAISQPLCTALQVALVDLLASAGVRFHGVVGHSSGEIAAVYAAGYIDACDAVRIAYYRGVHANRNIISSDLDGLSGPGKMMAVGLGLKEARTFCQRQQFAGRTLVVAASNSLSTSTLSGDSDAIHEARDMLDAEGVFARVLKVDKAYHSPHMNPCAEPYLDSLRKCNVTIRQREASMECAWFSSVHGPDGRSIDEPQTLKDTYWVDNLLQPVLFAQAVERAVMESHCYDLVIEVGPHATLRSPALETLKALTGIDLPYSGVLSRGINDMNAFADALGFVWSRFSSPSPIIDLHSFRKACMGEQAAEAVSLVKGLPSYVWDHDKPLWKESRVSKAYRERSEPPHELLGTSTSSGCATVQGPGEEIRFRNIMKISEMPWLRGHQFQGQVLFPAAGYVSMAIEAAVRLAPKDMVHTVQLVELRDLVIHNGITLEDDSSGTDVRFVIKVSGRTATTITAEYTCYSAGADSASQNMEKVNFTGRATVTLSVYAVSGSGPDIPTVLPSREASRLPMPALDLARFYSSMEDIGLQYSGDFLMQSASRRNKNATIIVPHLSSSLRIHPATLDTAFQGLFAAYCFPGDGSLRTSYLPTSIERVRVNMSMPTQAQQQASSSNEAITADCWLRSTTPNTLTGDVALFSGSAHRPELVVEGVTCSSFEGDSARHDRKIFAQTVWKPDVTSSNLPEVPCSADEVELAEIMERVAYFYLRRLRDAISPHEIAAMEPHFQCMMAWTTDYVISRVNAGTHPRLRPEFNSDTRELLTSWQARFRGQIDMELLSALGEALPEVCRGTIPTLQVLMQDDMLNRFYKEGLGFPQANKHLENLVSRFSHRYPRIRVLEIGAGTGGATVSALKGVASESLVSYTYTDISPGFFESARDLFREHVHKMEFRVLDIEDDPVAQGFDQGGYDLIIASNVLHATKFLGRTLQNCRKLMRPGGELMLIELTSSEETIRLSFLTSTLPGWWLGREDGRYWAPTLNETQWDTLLVDSGFSGVDVSRRDFEHGHYNTVMATQAVDDRVALLREPLEAPRGLDHSQVQIPRIEKLVIVGGKSLAVTKLIKRIHGHLRPFADEIVLVSRLEDIASWKSGPVVSLCLADLDEPQWKNMTESRFAGMQRMFLQSSHLLWVTKGRMVNEPYCNMTLGMGRSFLLESPEVALQFLDIDVLGVTGADAVTLASSLLRIVCLGSSDFEDVLWSFEHELCLEAGHLIIPRILPDQDLDDRLNAATRPIERTLDLGLLDSCVEVVQRKGQLVTLESDKHANCASAPESCNNRLIRVHASSLLPVSTRDRRLLFICIGSDLENSSEDKVIFLSQGNASIVCVSADDIVKSPSCLGDDDAEAIQQVLTGLVAATITYEMRGSLWVHEADDCLASHLSLVAGAGVANILLTTSLSQNDPMRTFIHPQTSARELARKIPRGAVRFVNGNANLETSTALYDMFRSACSTSDRDTDIHRISIFKDVRGRHSIALQLSQADLRRYLAQVHGLISPDHAPHPQASSAYRTHITKLKGMSCTAESPAHVVIWRNQDDSSSSPEPVTTSALVRSLALSSNRLFSGDKTYLLVGLTGEVGLSLCKWMADHGARHLVITSRNPDVSPAIIQDLERTGAKLRILSLDVSDRAALFKMHAEIVATMPPIAGVANGAMVLNDKAFSNTTLDHFSVVLAPKVTGSRNLDDLFATADLDFFIMFSSISSVVGSRGQSNYGAANLYMHALARQRRARGVAASVIDVAMLLGIGYVARFLDQYESISNVYSYMALSEPLLHDIFAAAILAGKPRSGHDPQLITGIAADANAPWSRDPRFSHYVRSQNNATEMGKQSAGGGGGDAAKTKASSVPVQLAALPFSDDYDDTGVLGIDIITRALSAKVELILQMPADTLDVSLPLIQVGIDSLVAVELRSWFLKEMGIEMPVLKFLNGSSISDLAKEALARFAASARAKKAAQGEEAGKETPPTDRSNSSTPSLSTTSETSYDTPSDNMDGNISTAITIATTDKSLYQRVGYASVAQARLYFLQEYQQKKSAYTVVMVGKTTTPFDIPRLQKAFDDIAQRHEGLRSAFFVDKSTGELMQGVKAASGITFQHRFINSPEEVHAEVKAQSIFEFDLEEGHTMIFQVLTEAQSPSIQHIIFSFAHIAIDGYSSNVVLQDLSRAYSRGTTLSSDSPETPPQQSIELCAKHRIAALPENLEHELKFWSGIYTTLPSLLPLMPFSRAKQREIMKLFDVEWHSIKVGPQLTRQVKALSTRLGATPFHVYLATLAAFLARRLGTDDFGIGMMESNRSDAADLSAVGYSLNILPLRFAGPAVAPQTSFESLAKHSRDMVYSALENSRAPLEVILEHLGVPRSYAADHHPLFQATMSYHLDDASKSSIGDVDINWGTGGTMPGYPYDLKFDVYDTAEGSKFTLTTQKYLYGAEDAKRLLEWFLEALDEFLADPKMPIGLMSVNEMEGLL